MQFLIMVLVSLCSFVGTAWAANAVDPGGSLSDAARPVYDAVMSGQYWYAAALALVFAFAAVKRYAVPHVKFLQTDAGVSLLLGATAFLGACATGLAAGVAPSLAMLKIAALTAVAAGGGYKHILKPIVKPALEYLQKLAPGWAAPLFAMVLWIFESPNAAAAKRAGKAALKKNPPSGAAGIVGEPRDVD
jgi:hypothetical protein